MIDRQTTEPACRPDADAVPEGRDEVAGDAEDQASVGDEVADGPWERLAELEAALDRTRQEAADRLAHLQRLQADFDNYRRRSQADRREECRRAKADLVLRLLSVLDHLDIALATADSGEDGGLRRGFELIARQLRAVLGDEGLEQVEALGRPFDPALHEAVARVETEDHPEGTVIEAVRAGYRLNDRVLRPAMVRVTAAPSAAAGAGDDGPAEASDSAESATEEQGGSVI